MSKKDVPAFLHDANARRDPKVLAMRSVWKEKGKAWFWDIVEILREQADLRLDYSSKYAFQILAQELFAEDPEEVKRFVDDCIHEFGLFASDGKMFWSPSLLERIGRYTQKRDSARNYGKLGAEKRWGDDSPPITPPIRDPISTPIELDSFHENKLNLNKLNSNEIEIRNESLGRGGGGKPFEPPEPAEITYPPGFDTPGIREWVPKVREKLRQHARSLNQLEFEALCARYGGYPEPASTLEKALKFTCSLTSARNVVDPPDDSRRARDGPKGAREELAEWAKS